MFSKLFSEVLNHKGWFNRKGAKMAQRSQRTSQQTRCDLCAILCVFAVNLFAVSFNTHEYHASVTNMQYNAKERTFEVSIRMFTDDLEKTLTRENGGQRVIFDKKYDKINDQLLEKYLRKHFIFITSSKQTRPFNYVGHEVEADAQWVYVELPFAEVFRGGTIQQSVLTDTFDDQTNLVTINYNTQKKTLLFRKNQTVQEVSL